MFPTPGFKRFQVIKFTICSGFFKDKFCRALPLDNDPGRHPVFALGLTRQAFRTVFHFWASREPETLFKIRLGKGA